MTLRREDYIWCPKEVLYLRYSRDREKLDTASLRDFEDNLEDMVNKGLYRRKVIDGGMIYGVSPILMSEKEIIKSLINKMFFYQVDN